MIRAVRRIFDGLLLAPAFLPLVYINGFLYPFVATKTFALRGFGILLVAAFVYLVIERAELFWSRLRLPALWLPGILLFVAYIASAFGADFSHSFWSTFERGDGLLAFTVVVAYFYAIILATDEQFLLRLARICTWVAGIAAIYVLLQWLQEATGLIFPLIEEPRGRFGGTFGNAAFLASYLGITLFLAILAAREYRGKWRRAAYVSGALQLLAVFISATRGTILALLVTAGLATVYLAWKGGMRVRFAARVALVGGLIATSLFFVFRAQLAHAPIVSVQRIASISLTDATVSSRIFIWKHMVTEVFVHPVFGIGAEHIDAAFDNFYDPRSIVEEWFDRSHNVYFDYALQYGLLGLVLYLGVILSALFIGYQLFLKDEVIGTVVILAGIVYAIQNMFVFDTALSLWLFLSLIAAAYAYAATATRTVLNSPRLPNLAAVVPAGAILLLIIPVVVQPMRANALLAGAYLYHVADMQRYEELLHKGFSLHTYGNLEYGYQVYSMYTGEQLSQLDGERLVDAHRIALDILKENFERYPYDARTAVYYAHVLQSVPPGLPVDEMELRRVIVRGKELTPLRMQPWFIEANIDLHAGDALPEGEARRAHYRKAVAVLEEYVARVPDYAEPCYVIANVYLAVGDKDAAKKWADEGLRAYTPDSAVAQRAVRFYLAVEDWPNVVKFLSDLVDGTPATYPALFDLAKAKYMAGDVAGAREIYEKLLREAPQIIDTDPAFKQAISQVQ